MKKQISKEKIKTWFVTGASSGIGKELCLQLVEKGYNVIAIARRLPKISHTNALNLSVDVTDVSAIETAINLGLEKFGKIDVVVNSAGISSYGTFEEETETEMRRVMEVNFWGAYNTISKLLPRFRQNKNGTIVNISSEMGLYPRAYGVAYCASKYAIEGLSSSLWWETNSFCRVLTVELDKFDGTEIGLGKQKGGSNIAEYQKLTWVPHKAYNFPKNPNDLIKAVSYIIAEVENEKPARRLMLGKTICKKTNEELKSIQLDLKKSLLRSYLCANIDIKKMLKQLFKYKFLSIFAKDENIKKENLNIYNTLKYLKKEFFK